MPRERKKPRRSQRAPDHLKVPEPGWHMKGGLGFKNRIAALTAVKDNRRKMDDDLARMMRGEKPVTPAQDSLAKILTGLNEEEKAILAACVGGTGEFNLDVLWTADYIKRPPTIEEFITDPYWLGETLLPGEDSDGLWPCWKEILTQDFDLDSMIHNIVITGSLGCGKSFASSAIFLYRVALSRLLKNPQKFFGLSGGSRIYFLALSVTMSVVSDTIFGDIQNFMARSPFFREECGFNPDQKYANMRIDLGNGIVVGAGSKGQHAIGRNVMGVLLDEGNWRLEAKPDEQAYHLYGEVRTRIRNRFLKTAAFLPAITILSSSARDETSFTESVMRDIRESGDSNQKIYRFPIYEAKKHKLQLSGKYFRVVHSLKNTEPYVLQGFYNKEGLPIPGDVPHEKPPDGAQTELVPDLYLEEFKRRVRTALQNLSGISTGGTNKLFYSMVPVELAIASGERAGIQNPNMQDVIPVSEEDDQQIWDYLVHSKFLIRRASNIQPLRHPEAPRFVHIDLATTSFCGLSVCHPVGNQLVEGLIRDGRPFAEHRTIIEYDFILTLTGGTVKPISFEKIQKFFFWLRDVCHFHFALITADQFQSVMPLQMLENRGFLVDQLSLDRTKTPYYQWRAGFEEGRIHLFRQAQLMREIVDLLDGDKKVDHNQTGSKDVTDSAAGAYFNAINNKDVPTTAILDTPVMANDPLPGDNPEEDEYKFFSLPDPPKNPKPLVFKA